MRSPPVDSLPRRWSPPTPRIFDHLILVGPMGLKPEKGEIWDIFPVTIRTHLRATVADPGTAEFGSIYGGEMTPEQFEAF